jgi:hypothetical protein
VVKRKRLLLLLRLLPLKLLLPKLLLLLKPLLLRLLPLKLLLLKPHSNSVSSKQKAGFVPAFCFSGMY